MPSTFLQLQNAMVIMQLRTILPSPIDNQEKMITIGSIMSFHQKLASIQDKDEKKESEDYTAIAQDISGPLLHTFFIQQIEKIIPSATPIVELKEQDSVNVISPISHLFKQLKQIQNLTRVAAANLPPLEGFIQNQLTLITTSDADEQNIRRLSLLLELTPSNILRFNSSLRKADFYTVYETFYNTNMFNTLEKWDNFYTYLMSFKNIISIEYLIKLAAETDINEYLIDLNNLTTYANYFRNIVEQSPGSLKQQLINILYEAIKYDTAPRTIRDLLSVMDMIQDCLDNEAFISNDYFKSFLTSIAHAEKPVLLPYMTAILPSIIVACRAHSKFGIAAVNADSKVEDTRKKHRRDDDEKRSGEEHSGTKKRREGREVIDISEPQSSLSSVRDSIPSTALHVSSSSSHVTGEKKTVRPEKAAPFDTSMKMGKIDYDLGINYKFSLQHDNLLKHFETNIFQADLLSRPENDPLKIALFEESKALYSKITIPAEKMCFIESLIDPSSVFEKEAKRRAVTYGQCLDYFENLIKDSVNEGLMVNGLTTNGKHENEKAMPGIEYPYEIFYPLIGAINIEDKTKCKMVLERLQKCHADPYQLYPYHGKGYISISAYAMLEGQRAVSLSREVSDKLPEHHPHTKKLFKDYVEKYKARLAAKTKPLAPIMQLHSPAAAASSSNGLLPSPNTPSSLSSSSLWANFSTRSPRTSSTASSTSSSSPSLTRNTSD